MTTQKQYQALVADRIFLGGANDVPSMVENDRIEVVIDLRQEATVCASDDPALTWIKIPLGDNAGEPQDVLFKQAIDAVVCAHREGKRVGFHCGGGKGRTGTVAVGVLLELGLCHSIDAAEAMAKNIRPVISLKPDQRASLQRLYP